MDFGNLKTTFFIDLVYELRDVNKKLRKSKSWRKDRSSRFSSSFMYLLHLTTTRGRFVKKCLDLHLHNQYSDVKKLSIESILGMSSKEVVHRILIKCRIQKLWPKMCFFCWSRSMKVRYFASELFLQQIKHHFFGWGSTF